MNCTDCGRPLPFQSGAPADCCYAKRDVAGLVGCLRVQLAATNERAGLAEIAARQERELREACEKALAEANERADREAAAHAETRRERDEALGRGLRLAAHLDEAGALLDAERAARERAERERDEALRHAQTSDAMMRQARDRAAALAQKVDEQTARAHEAERERDEAVKRLQLSEDERHAHANRAHTALLRLEGERDEAVKRADAMAGALRRVDQVLDFDNEESYVCDDREGAVWTAHGILKGARETFAALDAARGR